MKSNINYLSFLLVFGIMFIFQNCESDFRENDSFYSNYKDANGIVQGGTQEEGYNEYVENPFIDVKDEAISTFSIDADGGSYSNVRRYLNSNKLPPKGAVRTEELINYFRYDYPDNNTEHPISLNGEVSSCPWNRNNKLIRIGIKGKNIADVDLPNTNFVFLIDVSGSMGTEDKLGLLKESYLLFCDRMRPQDKVAIVTYAGSSQIVLQSTAGSEKSKIKEAIHRLKSGGGTAGAKGIITAYDIAQKNFIVEGNNRIILATDGDFNVGISSQEALIELIEEKRESGVFLSVLGFGSGNYKDGRMEQLANNGNGNYEYIDNIKQAEKVFIHEFSKFFTVAKDVKVQVEFNPLSVHSYRLIGYENRLLNNDDFKDDKKDAGEIAAGQEITALYEIVPILSFNRETFKIDFRYKLPDEDMSNHLELSIHDNNTSFNKASDNLKFACATIGYGMLLIDSKYKEDLTYEDVLIWLDQSSLFDPYGFKEEFRTLILKAKSLK